jgi:hypothetical protein
VLHASGAHYRLSLQVDLGGHVVCAERLCRTVSAGSYDFLGGTFFPALLAFESPIAIACFGLVTFLPLRPDLSWPFFISLISVSTFLPAEGEYLRPDDFFAEDFFAEVFLVEDFLAEELLVEDLFALVPFLVLPFRAEELLFLVLLDLFLAAFFDAISILLENQMFAGFESVVWLGPRSAISAG